MPKNNIYIPAQTQATQQMKNNAQTPSFSSSLVFLVTSLNLAYLWVLLLSWKSFSLLHPSISIFRSLPIYTSSAVRNPQFFPVWGETTSLLIYTLLYSSLHIASALQFRKMSHNQFGDVQLRCLLYDLQINSFFSSCFHSYLFKKGRPEILSTYSNSSPQRIAIMPQVNSS